MNMIAVAHFNSANALKKEGRLQEAAAGYQEALRLQPDYVEAHNNLGNVWLAQNKPDAALTHYQLALKLNPRHASAHNNLGAA